MRVLIVDDDLKYLSFVSRGLDESGIDCQTAEDGETALATLRTLPFDLVLLDVGLPGIDGWGVLEALRRENIDVPVIWVTARDAIDERIKGLRMGGDDYIIKPFVFGELLARIHAVLRRNGEQMRQTIGDIEVDYGTSSVTRAGQVIDLTRTELALLRQLTRHLGEVVTRTHLLQCVWGIDFNTETNVVDVHIARLRKKLDGPFDQKVIQTIRGSGYVFALEES